MTGANILGARGKRGPLEDKLGAVFVEIVCRHERAAQRRAERDAEAVEQERRRQVLLAQAQERYVEAYRGEVLLKQARDWWTSLELGEYLAAMEETADRLGDPQEQQEAQEWIDWAVGFAERLDPLRSSLRMPEVPDLTREELTRYMPRWSIR